MKISRFILSLVVACFSMSPVMAQNSNSAAIVAPVKNPFKANEVAVLIVMGQSNAEGWGQWLPDASRAGLKLPNVYGLLRTGTGNLGPTGSLVTWGNYSIKDSNLGDNYDSNSGKGYGSYHLAGEFSKLWQDYLNANPRGLPDLYVIHIAWGSQGFVFADAPNNRWSPEANVLFPLAKRVISQGMLSLLQQGKIPRVVGLHWNQWETEALTKRFKTTTEAEAGFRNYLANFRGLFGGIAPPTYLYAPRSTIYDASTTGIIKTAIEQITATGNTDNYHLMDAGLSPYYNPAIRNNFGIFSTTDNVHYLGKVQQWFAQKQWSNVFDQGILGAPITANNANGSSNAAADFDKDGKTDLLFKHSYNNTYALALINGSVYKTNSGTVQQTLQGWFVDQVADFDGDGAADLLFRQNGTNTYAIWYLDGLNPKKTSGKIRQPAANWFVEKSADFDGDGQADLLFSSPGTNNYVIWNMRGLDIKSGSLLQGIPQGWSVAQVADFDGDKKSDLLLNQKGTSNYRIWYSNGFSPKNTSGAIAPVAMGWSVVDVADFDGDAKADLLLKQEGTNNYAVWYMDGLTPKTTSGWISKPSADWYVVEAKDFDGDGQADLLFKQSNAENYQIWYMNGLATKSTSGVLSPP